MGVYQMSIAKGSSKLLVIRENAFPAGYAAMMNRLASSSKLALPYICRFSFFNLLFKPSSGPLLTSLGINLRQENVCV